MQITLLGTGTSHGVPVIGCDCEVCRSTDEHDKRFRSSAYVTQCEADGKMTAVIIDTGPEFRMQCLKYGVKKADAVLLTHSHADHLDGLDDVRIFSHTSSEGAFTKQGKETPGEGLTVYGNSTTLVDVTNRFDYIFKKTQLGGGKPKLRLVDCAKYTVDNPIRAGSISIIPVPMMHGIVPTTGWLFSIIGKNGEKHSFAYLTDLNYISDESLEIVKKHSGALEVLVIDGLRERHHSTHFTFQQALDCADKIGARHTYFTHICHSGSHEAIKTWCNEHTAMTVNLKAIVENGGTVAPAYDGLVLQVGED